MELKLIESSKNKIKFKLLGEGHTFCNILRKELWNDKDTKIAGYSMEHSLKSAPRFVFETSGNVKKALLDAVDRLQKQNKLFLSKVKKII